MHAAARVRSTDGVVLAVHDLGGTGGPLLLAHATGFHGRVWAPLARHLSDHHCWSLDFRGHGASTPPAGRGFDWEGFADDVAAVVAHLGFDRPVAVGHSKGGAALLMAEARTPGTFGALWVYEPIVFPPTVDGGRENSPLAEGARRRKPSFASHDEALANYAAKEPLAALDREALVEYVDHGLSPGEDGEVHLRCRPEWEAEVYLMGARHHGWDALPDVTCPVVVACGNGGAPAEIAPAIADRLPAGRLERFGDLGHFGPLQDPPAVAERIRRHLG